jgi:hypothetical protein
MRKVHGQKLDAEAEAMIKRLEEENERPDVTEWQREANKHRIEMYELIGQDKPAYEPITWENGIYEYMAVHKNHITPNDLID